MAADGTVKKLHKGGRGLAFWYTKVSSVFDLVGSEKPANLNIVVEP